MARTRFLHIGFDFKGPVKTKELEPAFNKGVDWIRYSPACWIVHTTSNPSRWYERLNPLLGPDDSVFICELNMHHRFGKFPKWAWEWINKFGQQTKYEVLE